MDFAFKVGTGRPTALELSLPVLFSALFTDGPSEININSKFSIRCLGRVLNFRGPGGGI